MDVVTIGCEYIYMCISIYLSFLQVLFVSLQLASVINAASIPIDSPAESHNVAKRDADAGYVLEKWLWLNYSAVSLFF